MTAIDRQCNQWDYVEKKYIHEKPFKIEALFLQAEKIRLANRFKSCEK